MNPLVSIIVPIYNVEQYLQNCLNSILGQTYGNLEIILVDDGSLDNCSTICDDYKDKDSRVVVIHKKNGGISDARNVGVGMAKGEFLMFVDADDWVEPTYCEKAVEAAINCNCDCVAFGINVVKGNGEIIRIGASCSCYMTSEESIKRIVERGFPCNYMWNKLFRRSLFDTIKFPIGVLFEDHAVMYRILHQSNGIYVIEDSLYTYRRGQFSLSSNIYSEKMIKNRFEIWLNRLHFLEANYPSISICQFKMICMDIIRGLCFIKTDLMTKYEIEQFLLKNKNLILHYLEDYDRNTKYLLRLFYGGKLTRSLYFKIMPFVIGKNKSSYRI